MRKYLILIYFFFVVGPVLLAQNEIKTQKEAKKAAAPDSCLMIRIKGIIAAGSQKYLKRGLNKAKAANQCLFVVLDTPGGHLQSTREMVQELLNAPVPTIVWVGPSGAHAGSAGVFITSAAHHAYMAQGTNIGAAHPIAGSGKDIEGNVGKKVLNDTKAFALGIAEKRNRNKTWIIASVEESVSVTADEALKLNVINGVADSPSEVMSKIWPGQSIPIKEIEPSLNESLATFLANPNLAYMLMGFGALGLYIEISNPGLLFPGITGLLCLMLSFISMNFIPINYGAVALTILGIVLLIAEMFVPSFGVLGVSGIVAFVLGSLFFVDDTAGVTVSLGTIIPTTLVIAGVALWVGSNYLKSRKLKPSHGKASLVGQQIELESWDATKNEGRGVCHGDIWNIRSESGKSYEVGQKVEIKNVDGLTVVVA